VHGEGGQVFSITRKGGLRNAECRNCPGDHPRTRQTRTAAGAHLSATYQSVAVPARVRSDRPQRRCDHPRCNRGNRGRDVLAKIDAIIEAVRLERYRWTPARRVYIEKKHSTKKRPLGLPTWSDKLLQEVMRLILEAYFEPQFSDHSHGFRTGRGCHTALGRIYH